MTRKFSTSWRSSISIRSPHPKAHSLRPMAHLWMRFRSSLSTMTEFSSRIGFAFLIAAASIAIASAPAPAQQTPVISLTLGDAARLAARQSALARGSRLRADEADARVRQRKADLLPNFSSYVQEAGRTFNTSTLGIDFPTPPGQKPVFDPQGQIEGPVNTLDVRGRVQQNLLDFGALGRVRSAEAAARSSSADADATAEQAATI